MLGMRIQKLTRTLVSVTMRTIQSKSKAYKFYGCSNFISASLVLRGTDLESEHCVFENLNDTVTLIPLGGAQCAVNGAQVVEPTQLRQGKCAPSSLHTRQPWVNSVCISLFIVQEGKDYHKGCTCRPAGQFSLCPALTGNPSISLTVASCMS